MMNYDVPIGRTFSILVKKYLAILSRVLTGIDLERHFFAVILIGENNGRITQQKLAEELNIDKVSAVRVIDYLCKMHYVERTVNKSDRREHLLLLTKKGEKNFPVIKEGIKQANEHFCKGLNKEEKALFFGLLETLRMNHENVETDKIQIKYKRKLS